MTDKTDSRTNASDTMPQFNFPKTQKLCSRDSITQVFSHGKTFMSYPLQFRYLPADTPETRIMVSAPKKRFKRAVVRNRLKRLMREAYRLNRHNLCGEQPDAQTGIYIVCCYVGQPDARFAAVEQAMIKGLQHIAQNTGQRK